MVGGIVEQHSGKRNSTKELVNLIGEKKMGREVRKVPKDWEHPKSSGTYTPLFDNYNMALKEFQDDVEKMGLGEALDYHGGGPDSAKYMPCWLDEEKTHYMMYEDTTEGTPISPAFETPEDLAMWLYKSGANSFGGQTASYEGWLRVARGGYACSAVLSSDGLVNGVDAL